MKKRRRCKFTLPENDKSNITLVLFVFLDFLFLSGLDGIWTRDQQIKSLLLYQAELRAHKIFKFNYKLNNI